MAWLGRIAVVSLGMAAGALRGPAGWLRLSITGAAVLAIGGIFVLSTDRRLRTVLIQSWKAAVRRSTDRRDAPLRAAGEGG
jgi:hypothetical protein